MNSGAVRAWRLLVAGCGAAGVLLAAQAYDVWWTALSQLANLAVAVGYAGFAIREPRSPLLRGSLTSLMLLVSLAYLPMQNGNLTEPWSVVEHVVTPALVVADFLLVGDSQTRVRRWHPLAWMVPPLLYLGWYVAADLAVYDALDAGQPAPFLGRVTVLAALLLVCGLGLYAVGRRQGARAVVRASG